MSRVRRPTTRKARAPGLRRRIVASNEPASLLRNVTMSARRLERRLSELITGAVVSVVVGWVFVGVVFVGVVSVIVVSVMVVPVPDCATVIVPTMPLEKSTECCSQRNLNVPVDG